MARNPRVQVWLEAVRLVKAYFGDEVYLRGNCDQCPFSLAGMMRTPALWMMDLLDEDKREDVFRLLDYCARAAKQFLCLMAETGAHMMSNGDSPAGPDVISPKMYRLFAQPWEKQVVDQAHALGLPYVLHICGNATSILDEMLAAGVDALELDYKTDTRGPPANEGSSRLHRQPRSQRRSRARIAAAGGAKDARVARDLFRHAAFHPQRRLCLAGNDARDANPNDDPGGTPFPKGMTTNVMVHIRG